MNKEVTKQDEIITVMGIGGGGMNVLKRSKSKLESIKNVKLLSVNTDKQLLDTAETKKLLIGEKRFAGLGCGGNLEKGKQAVIESEEEIKKELQGTTKLIIITCLGGGTGTGASSEICKIAREMGIKTVAFVTLPFTFEGKKRSYTSLLGLDNLTEYAESVFCIKNDSIIETVDRKATFREAFSVVDTVVAEKIAEYIKNNDDKIFKDSQKPVQKSENLKSSEVLYEKESLIYFDNYCSKAKTYFESGVKNFSDKNYKKAIEYFKLTVKQLPCFAVAYYNLGICYLKMKDYYKAIENLNLAIEHSDKNNSDAYYNLGYAYFKSGDTKNATTNYSKAIEISPEIDFEYYENAN